MTNNTFRQCIKSIITLLFLYFSGLVPCKTEHGTCKYSPHRAYCSCDKFGRACLGKGELNSYF